MSAYVPGTRYQGARYEQETMMGGRAGRKERGREGAGGGGGGREGRRDGETERSGKDGRTERSLCHCCAAAKYKSESHPPYSTLK